MDTKDRTGRIQKGYKPNKMGIAWFHICSFADKTVSLNKKMK